MNEGLRAASGVFVYMAAAYDLPSRRLRFNMARLWLVFSKQAIDTGG